MLCNCIHSLWNGLDWGDVGGWLSGIGTIAAVVIALRQTKQIAQRDREIEAQRRQESREIAALMLKVPVITSAKKAYEAQIELERDDRVFDQGMFCKLNEFNEAKSISELRSHIVHLPKEVVMQVNSLLAYLLDLNQRLQAILTHGQVAPSALISGFHAILLEASRTLDILDPILKDNDRTDYNNVALWKESRVRAQEAAATRAAEAAKAAAT